MHLSKSAQKPHPVLQVDGMALEQWIDAENADVKVKADTEILVPAQGWLIHEEHAELAWRLLMPTDSPSSTIVPLLICPDDLDMHCTLLVVEQVVCAERVCWLRFGQALDVIHGLVVSVDWRSESRCAEFDKGRFVAAVHELKRLSSEEWH